MTNTPDQSFKLPGADAKDYLEQAAVLMEIGKFEEAVPLYENALACLERTYGEEQPELAECLQDLAHAYEAASRLTDALRIHTRALRLGVSILGNDHPAIIEILFKLTQMNETLGRPSDALGYCEQALESAKKCLPQDSPLTQQIVDRYYHLSNLAGRPARMQPQFSSQVQSQFPSQVPAQVPSQIPAQVEESGQKPIVDSSNNRMPHAEVDLNALQKDYADAGLSDAPPADTGGGARPAPSPIKAARTRGRGDESKKNISIRQMAKDFAMPVVGLVTVVALVLFFVLHNSAAPNTHLSVAENKTAVSAAQNQAKTAIYTRYRTADGSKEVRLVDSNLALLINGNNALEVPYIETTPDWNGLGSALVSSVQEKQIWAEKNESQLRTEDNTVYYSADGPEVLVIAKMGRLAGNAQACFLRTGEYPKTVSSDMLNQFSFQNPLDGKEAANQIRVLMDKASDGADAKTNLDSGLMTVDEPANTPCKITCYAVVVTITDARGSKLKATKFFVRGCDRNGKFLSSGRPGGAYVITASDAYLMAPEVVVKARPRTPGHRQESGQEHSSEHKKEHSKLSPESKSEQSILPTVQREKPPKPTRLWIIPDPPCALMLIHYGLPFLLLGLAVAAFVRSRMVAVDVKGRTTSSGSNAALVVAQICLGLAVLAMLAQLVIFR